MLNESERYRVRTTTHGLSRFKVANILESFLNNFQTKVAHGYKDFKTGKNKDCEIMICSVSRNISGYLNQDLQ